MTNPLMVMTTRTARYRETIRRTLAHRAGEAPDASAVAEAITSTWSQVASLLTPMIGARGADVTFRRSLYLTSKAFPWLGFDQEHVESDALLVTLTAHVAAQDADTAAEAGYTLLANFIELLTTLIGESLTEHILSSVWISPLPTQEKTS
jgi:hypothetical protein